MNIGCLTQPMLLQHTHKKTSLVTQHLNMAGFRISAWLITSALLFVTDTNGDRITEKIYHKIEGGFSCFRRLNATHQIGCSCELPFFDISNLSVTTWDIMDVRVDCYYLASSAGDVGVVHFIDSDESLKWLIDVGPHAPYVVMLPPEFFKKYNSTRHYSEIYIVAYKNFSFLK